MKRVIVFGGDGFLGWPLSLKLKALGLDVLIVDDLSRRAYDRVFEVSSLVPISSTKTREKNSGIPYYSFAVDKDVSALVKLVRDFSPDACVHFAQQRSAPVSMYSIHRRLSTISRNNASTLAILELVRTLAPRAKILHMGTMGVYGYDSPVRIEEGYDSTGKLLPMNPGSVYHLTKCHDQLTFQTYQKLYSLDIVDLHQGIVWGSQTPETLSHTSLWNRFDYDSMYGTVFNRFIAQYVSRVPLTVYGDGEQKRAFIHIKDSVTSCVNALFSDSSPAVTIANQFSELFTVRQVAEKVLSSAKIAKDAGLQFIDNPRVESASDFTAVNTGWLQLLRAKPQTMTPELVNEEIDFARSFADRYNHKATMPFSKW